MKSGRVIEQGTFEELNRAKAPFLMAWCKPNETGPRLPREILPSMTLTQMTRMIFR